MAGRDLELILTHEHTDFDALASLLGASLLFPSAVPVLPRQMNRNVREFLALYPSHLPFLHADDLPKARIARIVLVDTRALSAPRGLAEGCEVQVIDHHVDQKDEPPRSRGQRAVPASWQIWSEPVGANTTLLVEKLAENRLNVTPVQATLLALGIHEDTGSLTYGGTTHRDAAALAWLLEPDRGVNMDVVNQFLHHPLGESQRALLQDLIEHSEFLQIEGQTVVIAQAHVPHFTEEISTVAARLRDFHEPDAVFLIITLRDVVQVVARSATDEIDVGAIARVLGGGGHGRAAAAPLHGRTPQSIRDEIVRLVRDQARAAVTVRDIMSVGRPQMISPDATINEAAALMRRYGHEGFPVVIAGSAVIAESAVAAGAGTGAAPADELLGVITRREADRAINHGLGAEPVRRFMNAGRITVRPADSIPFLRRTMIDSGWGQVPVVDDENRIVGIVTRTDLIKLWDDSERTDRATESIERTLAGSLAPTHLALLRLVGVEVSAMDFTVYVVGGFVRDLLLQAPSPRVRSLDLDIVIEGDGIAFAHRMRDHYGGRVVQHRQFGTAKWLLKDPAAPVDRVRLSAALGEWAAPEHLPAHLDFVTARTEFYTAPTVLPTVESSSIKLDLHRRDFTINTLALCLNPDRWGQLLDFYGGLDDLRRGIIRALHSLSFVDDPTRILRAVRYEQRFGFAIEPRTLELIDDALDMLDRVSPARVRHELERILQEAEPERILLRLDERGVLARIHPMLQAGEWVAGQMAQVRAAYTAAPANSDLRAEPLERLYWAVLAYPLDPTADEEVAARLGLRHATQRFVRALHWLRRHHARLADPALRPSQIVPILDDAPLPAHALFALLCGDTQIVRVLDAYRTTWSHIHAELDGNDLRAMGVPRGPIYRELLARLRAARLDGEVRDRDGEVALVRAWQAGSSATA